MEINPTNRTALSNLRRLKQAGSSDSGFKVPDDDGVRAPSVCGNGPIAAVESLLTLQGLDDSTSGRSRGVSQGEQLLDMLDQVRDGLLSGGIPRTTLTRLAVAGKTALSIQNFRRFLMKSNCGRGSNWPSSNRSMVAPINYGARKSSTNPHVGFYLKPLSGTCINRRAKEGRFLSKGCSHGY